MGEEGDVVVEETSQAELVDDGDSGLSCLICTTCRLDRLCTCGPRIAAMEKLPPSWVSIFAVYSSLL